MFVVADFLQGTLVAALSQGGLEGVEGGIEVAALGLGDRDTHVTNAEVLGSNLDVETTSGNDTVGSQLGEQVGSSNALGVVDSGHAVGSVLQGGGDELQAEVVDELLGLQRSLLVDSETLLDTLGNDLLEGDVKSVDVLDSGGGKVRGLAGLVGVHDGQPAVPVGVVVGDGGLAGLEDLNGTGRDTHDAETGRGAESLLGSGNNDINAPGIHADLLRADGANTIDNDQGLGGLLADNSGNALDVRENTGGGIDVGDGDGLELLALQGSGNGSQLRGLADGDAEVGNLGTVGLQASRWKENRNTR